MQGEPPPQRILVAGATGYVGRHVVQTLAQRGHEVIAIARDYSDRPDAQAVDAALDNARRVSFDDVARLSHVDSIVSCLASRTGVAADAWRVDHGLNQQLLDSAGSLGARRFVLLSAICVQRPRLAFQFAKREFEKSLQASGLDHAIVRPTAYFKSLAGQIERVRRGKPFMVFGNGKLTACIPISARDLALFIAHHIEARDAVNAIVPIGGPGPALTPLDCGHMLFELSGREPAFRHVPPGMFRAAHTLLRPFGRISGKLRAKAELARIGHYYATESMLVWDDVAGHYSAEATPSFGKDTLRAFFAHALDHGLAGHALGDQRVFGDGATRR